MGMECGVWPVVVVVVFPLSLALSGPAQSPRPFACHRPKKTSLNLLFLLLLLVKSNGLTFFFSPTPLLHFFIVSVLRSGQPVSIPVGLPFSELVDYQVARPRLGRAAETKRRSAG